MSLTRPAGRTSSRLSILSSPMSGRLIRSLLFAKKPATTMPKRLPSKNIAVVLLLRVFLCWRETLISSAFLGSSGVSGAGLPSRGVGDSEGVSLARARRRRRADAMISAADCPWGHQAEQASNTSCQPVDRRV